ncbi:MAG: hypothetical protein EXR70_02880 [Deltaproteobacteria bacterium]|nr:hypothetical protein [Deltaproteobacteria bacterium]
MSWIKAALLAGLLSNFLMTFAPDASAADRKKDRRRDASCQRGDRLNIEDLDMSPDPVSEGQRIRSWKVRIRFDGRRDCETEVYVREGNTIAGHARDYKMHPGVNEIEIPAAQGYRFSGREHCFNVQVDLDGTRQQIDAARRFCATQRSAWSMREADDRGRVPR